MILAAMLLAVSGPFGTFQSFNLGQRIAYWAVMVMASYLVGQAAATFFLELLRPQIAQRWPRVIVAGLLAGLPVTIVVLVINGVAYQHVDLATSLTIWLYATIVTLAVVVLFVTLSDLIKAAGRGTAAMAAGAVPPPAPIAPPAPPPILERVPLPQRGKLLALMVEDHYVDIVTDKGKTLVLMRLADAIRETGGSRASRSTARTGSPATPSSKSTAATASSCLELSNGLQTPGQPRLPARRQRGRPHRLMQAGNGWGLMPILSCGRHAEGLCFGQRIKSVKQNYAYHAYPRRAAARHRRSLLLAGSGHRGQPAGGHSRAARHNAARRVGRQRQVGIRSRLSDRWRPAARRGLGERSARRSPRPAGRRARRLEHQS